MTLKLSVIIITQNEAERIETCLRSIAWADEIIILDSGSTDNTVALCKQYTEQVFVTDWPGFGVQKNRALSKATGDWVLSLDADEYISDVLGNEIRTLLQSDPHCVAYKIHRLSYYLGKIMRHGDWAHDHCLRLFKRKNGQFTEDIVHEKLVISEGKIGMLQNPFYHMTFRYLEQVIEKMNAYSTLSAKIKHKTGKRGTLFKAIGHGVWTFLRGYILKRGFLDGQEGFLLAVSNAEGSYYRYLKLMYM